MNQRRNKGKEGEGQCKVCTVKMKGCGKEIGIK